MSGCAHETADDEGPVSDCLRGKQNFNIFAVYIGLPIQNLLYKLLNNVTNFGREVKYIPVLIISM